MRWHDSDALAMIAALAGAGPNGLGSSPPSSRRSRPLLIPIPKPLRPTQDPHYNRTPTASRPSLPPPSQQEILPLVGPASIVDLGARIGRDGGRRGRVGAVRQRPSLRLDDVVLGVAGRLRVGRPRRAERFRKGVLVEV